MDAGVVAAVVGLAVAAYVAYGRHLSDRTGAEKRQILNGLKGREVTLGVNWGRFIVDERGTVSEVGARSVTLSNHDGQKSIPYSVIRDINRGHHRLGRW